jgi:hypothetical protein
MEIVNKETVYDSDGRSWVVIQLPPYKDNIDLYNEVFRRIYFDVDFVKMGNERVKAFESGVLNGWMLYQKPFQGNEFFYDDEELDVKTDLNRIDEEIGPTNSVIFDRDDLKKVLLRCDLLGLSLTKSMYNSVEHANDSGTSGTVIF